ncbi:MAG: cupin domain-containing protein [Saprospiraceae bacterium]|nr:cupin domain-containing protein [Saprospiraceae bacterium]
MKTLESRIIENPLIKDRVTFLETSAETNGKYTLVQVELAPGGGNELHYHKTFEETFTAVEGVLGIQVGKQIIHLNKGESATAPIGSLHRFFNPSGTEKVVFNVLLQPGSEGFERTLQVAYGLARDGRTSRKGVPKSLHHMALIIQWSDTNLPGVFSWLEKGFRLLARRAIKKGMDKELIEQYCRI